MDLVGSAVSYTDDANSLTYTIGLPAKSVIASNISEAMTLLENVKELTEELIKSMNES